MIRNMLSIFFAASLFSSPGALAQTAICIPQFLDGELDQFRWRTTIVLHNQDRTQAQVQMNFYDNNGAPLRQFEMMRRGAGGTPSQIATAGHFAPEPIRGRSAVGYQSAGREALQGGYVMIQSQNKIEVHTRLQLYDSADNLIMEEIVFPGFQFRQAGFFADRADGANIGLALTNPSNSQTATCTLEIIDLDGTSVLGTTQFTLGPHSQIARFLFELFPDILTDGVGFVRIVCDQPVCALALNLRGLVMAQIPVVIED